MFSLLLLPLGSVINLITPQVTAGSIGKLYESAENISHTYSCDSANYGTGNGGASAEGFVKEGVTYMITDDLEVTPWSISSINRFLRKNVRLEEKTVVIGMKEVG
ncbi:hypothetical protein KSP40_PGU018711 [Platanthera guangdongensis]|uniref:NodB homology domain-containing protein n=1 Tax=Platanthera guangdongensis TaxID=2320717 RepID=A0ABR2MRV0_9ASPA